MWFSNSASTDVQELGIDCSGPLGERRNPTPHYCDSERGDQIPQHRLGILSERDARSQ